MIDAKNNAGCRHESFPACFIFNSSPYGGISLRKQAEALSVAAEMQ
jgi:hypothetical protein